ncbi:hypothetical protein BOX15_Mlig004693g1 [Macrostomum lignano]|uniref:CDP-diacylglycerol--inositol 3-phosphatidyltransferase n=1 Tax=Macrostomum lignano TaxID=282301 RepID=A0A267FWL1_9PLAT|nr:hypothetical protein BOX15_Mlig004693g3 [Macrostomum lignano]PAA81845.1 hypothetical protein BOX15_Mlig004693g1 [Macrostomum lignano]
MMKGSNDRKNIYLYVPNLIDYARLLFLLAGLLLLPLSEAAFPLCYVASSLLDLVDGWAARRLKQTSSLGAWLDVICDNLGRACLWHLSGSRLGPLFVSVEWLAFAANQRRSVATASAAAAWKSNVQRQMPGWLSRLFDNGFYNPMGALAMAGLFGLPMAHFLLARAMLPGFILGCPALQWAALTALYTGRLLALAAELHCIWFVIDDLVTEDQQSP